MSKSEKPPTTTTITIQKVASTQRLPAPQPTALRAGHVVARPGRDVTDIGAVRGLGIPRIAQDLAVGIERVHVAFPRVTVHPDMLSHPTP